MADLTKVETFERYVPIVKATPGGFVLAPVLIPRVVDQVGDWIEEEEIEKAMVSFAENGRKIDLQHQSLLTEGDVTVVESYILRSASTINGVALPRGTWLLGLRLSPRLRKMVADGQINGLSMKGRAVRTEMVE
ncbi:MAG: hypothetical protein HY574_09535 [candidate division NC10 bacterium]|nr:hypothetical protein [candidate division NC10 bacterium]